MIAHTFSRIAVGLVRRTWLVGMVTVAVCAAFAAHAVASIVEARHLDGAPPPALQPRPIVEVAPISELVPDGSALVERNMFCSACRPAGAPRDVPGPTNAFVPAAELIATTIGIVPVATVRVPVSEVQGAFTVGEAIPGVGMLVRVGFSSVDVRDDLGRLGTLSLRPVNREEAVAATTAPAAPASELDARVRKIDDTTFEVERSLVRDLVSGSVSTAGARIMPVNKAGKLDGLRLFGVRPGALAASMGLANGDVLQAINNEKIENANTLLELYARLDKLDHVTLDGTRRGKPLTLTLRLR